MRGLPGSGKSHVAKLIRVICFVLSPYLLLSLTFMLFFSNMLASAFPDGKLGVYSCRNKGG